MITRKLFLVIVTCFISLLIFAKEISIISFNDYHGRFVEVDKSVGLAKFATAVKDQVKAADGNAIVVSGGDNYQGTALSVLTHGAPVNDLIKELGVKLSAVGNHEFDWGQKYFKIWQKNGNFTYLACNIFNTKTGKLVDWAKPYKILEVDGVKVAFIGISTLETMYIVQKSKLKGIIIDKDVSSAQKWIDFLKAGKAPEGRPDVIIALTHLASYQDEKTGKITGDELVSICTKTKGFDVVISAHTHQYVCGEVNKIPVVQAMWGGEALAVLKITLTDNNVLESIKPEVVRLYKIADQLKPDKETQAILDKYKKEYPSIFKVIGKAEGEMSQDAEGNDSSMGYWITKSMAQETYTQIAFINSGGIRDEIRKGNITVEDIFNVSPFDNKIVTMKLSGKDLQRVVEHCFGQGQGSWGNDMFGQFYGLKVNYDSSAKYGNKVLSMSLLNNKPIEMNQYYTVSAIDFIYAGGDKFDFKGAKDVIITKKLLRNLLIDAVKKQKTLKPDVPDYILQDGKELEKAA